MGDISEGAVHLSNSLYTGKTGYGVKSMLCTGAAWDSMLDFIKDKDHDVTSSTSWGNYKNNLWNIINPSSKYSTNNGSLWTSGAYGEKTANADILLSTGASDTFSKQGIYDLAGNVSEWTLEYNPDVNNGACRGGEYGGSGTNIHKPAANRDYYNTLYIGPQLGFRVSLYK